MGCHASVQQTALCGTQHESECSECIAEKQKQQVSQVSTQAADSSSSTKGQQQEIYEMNASYHEAHSTSPLGFLQSILKKRTTCPAHPVAELAGSNNQAEA